MGEDVIREDRPTNEPTTGGTGGKRGRSKGTGTADAGGSGGGRGTGGAGVGGTTAPTEKEKPIELAILSPEEQEKRDKRNARRRELRAQRKAEGGATTKKPQKVKGNKGPEIDRTQLNGAIVGFFGIIASRPKCEQWAITEEEADSITAPLCNILRDSDVFEKVAEHSDKISLAMACASVFVPRALVTYQIIKEEKDRERRVKESTKQQERKATTSSAEHDREKPATSKGPAHVMPWYGDPIA